MSQHLHDPRLSGNIIVNGVELTATAAQLNDAAAKATSALVAAGSALAVTAAEHDQRVIALDTLAGSTATLPAATGSGARFKFIVTAEPTSNAHVIQVAALTDDEFIGQLNLFDVDSTDTHSAQVAQGADDFDTITLDGVTLGGEVGDWIEVTDIAAGVWAVTGELKHTGDVGTPLSDESIAPA